MRNTRFTPHFPYQIKLTIPSPLETEITGPEPERAVSLDHVVAMGQDREVEKTLP